MTESVPIDEAATRLRSILSTRLPTNLSGRLDAFDGLAQAMLRRDPVLGDYLARPGVAFLAGFLQRSNLESLLAREFPDPESLQRFVSAGTRKSIRAVPRGLVCHWLAGNVPLLGALSWAISALVGNVNLLRLSSRQDDPIGPLLPVLDRLGETGKQMAAETVVVRFDRDDLKSHQAMSQAADVRLAWGGREAVEAVRSLPSRWECEDLVLGPRTSLAVIDPHLANEATLGRLATDIAMFDQQACSSPQVIYVRGCPGEQAWDSCLDQIVQKLGDAATRFVRHPLDAGETYRISLDRTRLLLGGASLHHDGGTQWTVAVADRANADVRCVNRFVQVVPFQHSDEVIDQLPHGVQTVVTLLDSDDHDHFTESAALRGVCRFPLPGEGNFFESPWDGVPFASRLTRWVTRTQPRRS